MKYFQVKNSILGGAIGDALGYAVEFMSEDEIFSKYGKKGITKLEIRNGVAEISDDTQMTLFTITGILEGITRGKMRGIMAPLENYCYSHYKEWYKTQTERYEDIMNDKDLYKRSWLLNHKEMYVRRAPGNTCLSALAKEEKFNDDIPINNSKGCGGIMRVAPIGLYLAGKTTYKIIAETTIGNVKYTHGHPLAYIPAAYLSVLLAILINEEDKTLEDAVNYAFSIMSSNFHEIKYFNEFRKIYNKAISLSKENINDLDAIHELGEGWVAEETLAIALYCALKYKDDFVKAITVATNHNGDSDSTASITGQIIGATQYELCDSKFYDKLELKDVINELSSDLYHDCLIEEYGDYKDVLWKHKYISKDYFINKDCVKVISILTPNDDKYKEKIINGVKKYLQMETEPQLDDAYAFHVSHDFEDPNNVYYVNTKTWDVELVEVYDYAKLSKMHKKKYKITDEEEWGI